MRKKLLNALGVILLLFEIAEYLALPVLFVVVGLILKLGWQYYLWTVGGYLAVLVLIELVATGIAKLFGKVYESRIRRKCRSIAERYENNEVI